MKIERCPKCGGTPHVLCASAPWHDYTVECSECGFDFCETGAFGDTPKEAMEIWNDCVQDYIKEKENGTNT